MQAEYIVVQEGQSLAEAQANTAIDLRPLWWFSRSLAAIADAAGVTPRLRSLTNMSGKHSILLHISGRSS